MKICVLMKQVASEDSPLKINDDKQTIDSVSLNLVTNEPDTYALEEALLIKEKTSGEVTICTLGPDSSQQVIKDGLAKGADRAIHISGIDTTTLSPLEMAKIINHKIKDENFDIILSGLQSNDFGYAQLGIIIAEYLNYSHASLVMGTEILNNQSIKVKRELENGWFQWAELALPTCLSIQSGINQPRYATLKGIMSVKNKEVQEFSKDNLDYEENNSYKVMEKFIPQKSKETETIDGSPDEIVEKVIDIMKNKLRLVQ